MANPYGRPKVADSEKKKMRSYSLTDRQHNFVMINGGSRYVSGLIDREMMTANASIPTPPDRPVSGLVERLKKMSEGEK